MNIAVFSACGKAEPPLNMKRQFNKKLGREDDKGDKIKICYADSAKNIHMQRWKKGLNIGVFDEMFDKEEIESLGLTYMKPDDADIVFDLKIIKR